MTRPLSRRIPPVETISATSAFAALPPLNVFRTLARSEPLASAFHALGGHLLGAGALPDREREIVILRTGWCASSEYEFGQHTRLGLLVGLTAQEISALAGVGEHAWSSEDAVLLSFVDDLCQSDVVSDATWSAAAARWTDEQLLELLVLVGFYRLVSGMLNSAGVALEADAPGWPAGASAPLAAPREEAAP